jgi:hypothetical protein
MLFYFEIRDDGSAARRYPQLRRSEPGGKDLKLATLAIATFMALAPAAKAVAGEATSPPQVSCRAVKTTWVDASDLTAHTTSDTTVYDIVGEDLFILPSDRARYRYNSIRAVAMEEPSRFLSGHFTLLFSDDHRRLTLVRTNEQDVRVTTARCQPSKKVAR